MGTFLTNPRMAPALRARIEASVRGERRNPSRRVTLPRTKALVRAGIVVLVVTLVVWVLQVRRAERQALERQRAALLEAVRAQSASLGPDDRGAVGRIEAWLPRFAGPYEGDFIAPEARPASALTALVARPMVYVRGPLEAFAAPSGIAGAAAASVKDALAVCLVEPAASRGEKALLGKVRPAYSGSLVEQKTPNVRRLQEAEVGLPFFSPPWAEKVRAAETERELTMLKIDLDRAPLDKAKAALKATLLLVAVDESSKGTGPTELDGERAHDVRVGLVDLAGAKVLLRVRKRVDPSGWSASARNEFATGLDGCALAFDIYDAVGR